MFVNLNVSILDGVMRDTLTGRCMMSCLFFDLKAI